MTFHATQYGAFGSGFIADLSGQVGTTAEDVLTLNWPETLDREMAIDIARHNAEALTDAVEGLSRWREASR